MTIVRTTRRVLVAATLALAAMATLPAVAQTDAPAITVFAAASLKNAMDEQSEAYSAKTHVQVKVSYAASSALARQIEQGAPADLFISADSQWMDYVAGKKLIDPASRRNLLTNHLALIAPIGSKVKLKIAKNMKLAAALKGGRLAVAGPEVPAGNYAKASLTSLGVWDEVKDKLAPGDNVRAALAFVARGETPLGIVYDTDAMAEPKVRIVGIFPDSSHPPIVYPVALMAKTNGPAPRAFLDYLETPEAAAIFWKYGFSSAH